MSTNSKKPRKAKQNIDYRKLTDISSDSEEITRDFMNEGLSLKPTIDHCSPHNTTEGAVGDINNPDLDSEIARLEKRRGQKMLMLKQLRKNISTLQDSLQQEDTQQV